MKQKEIKTNKNKLRSLILSFVIAIAAWSVITYMTDVDISKRIPGIKIEVTGKEALASKGLVVANENDLPQTTIKITGKRNDLIEALDNIGAVVDVSEITEPGEYSVAVSPRIPINSISVDKLYDATTTVNIQELQTKEFPVTVYHSSSVNGKVVESVANPEKITVRGTAEELDKITGVCATVDLSSFEETQIIPLAFMVSKDTEIKGLGTLRKSQETVEVKNIAYEAQSVSVMPYISYGVGRELDLEATQITPSEITVGIKEGGVARPLMFVVDEYTEEEKEYQLTIPEGIYVEPEQRTVKIKPVWK